MDTILEKSKEFLIEKRYTVSIMWKIMLIYLAIVAIMATVVSLYIFGNLRGHFFKQNEEQSLNTANIIASVTADYLNNSESMEEQIKLVNIPEGLRSVIVDSDTSVKYDNSPHNNMQGKKFIKPAVATALIGKDNSSSYNDSEAGWVVEAAVPIIKNSQTIGVVYLSGSLEEDAVFVEEVWLNLMILIAISGIALGILAFFMARRITRPIMNLTNSITTMPTNDLQRVEIESHDEVANLAEAFNKLIDQLEALEHKRTLFVSDASHELKTPLASIKLIADSIIQTDNMDPDFIKEFLGDLNDEVDRLTRIVNKLLSLTKMNEEGLGLSYENINIVEVINSIIRKLSTLAGQADITVDFNYNEYILVSVDGDKITEAIYNIIDNAIKYTPEGGKVVVDIVKNQKNITISVEDNGQGIPEEDLDHVFDRFYRVDNSRTRETGGTGLGLSIAKEAVELHGGHVEVLSEVDKGTKFIIFLPEVVV